MSNNVHFPVKEDWKNNNDNNSRIPYRIPYANQNGSVDIKQGNPPPPPPPPLLPSILFTSSFPSNIMEKCDTQPQPSRRPPILDNIEDRTKNLPPTSAFTSNRFTRLLWNILLSSLAPFTDQDASNPSSIGMGTLTIVLGGVLLGLIFPKDDKFPSSSYAVVSSCMGYIYFFAWSVSFYPQIVSNFRRKTTQGLSVDFTWLNVFGFVCYLAYTIALYHNSTVRNEYYQRYGVDAAIPVQSNDVAFAAHALPMSIVTLLQIVYYDGTQRVWAGISPCCGILLILILVVTVVGAILAMRGGTFFRWLDYAYTLAFCKLMVTFVKHIPQVVLNRQCKSTVGWSIWQTLLDVTGGIFSNLQLILDCAALHDFSGLTGNIPKLLLGQISLLFDVILCTQHYILYPASTSSTTIILSHHLGIHNSIRVPTEEDTPATPIDNTIEEEDAPFQPETI